MIRAFYHLCRHAALSVASRHLLATNPLHDDLPHICDAKRESASIVESWLADGDAGDSLVKWSLWAAAIAVGILAFKGML